MQRIIIIIKKHTNKVKHTSYFSSPYFIALSLSHAYEHIYNTIYLSLVYSFVHLLALCVCRFIEFDVSTREIYYAYTQNMHTHYAYRHTTFFDGFFHTHTRFDYMIVTNMYLCVYMSIVTAVMNGFERLYDVRFPIGTKECSTMVLATVSCFSKVSNL